MKSSASTLPPVKWAAQLAHVREVSLLGTGDLAFWRQRLEREQLCPLERDGDAQLMIVAADSQFKRIAFQELSICVLAARQEDRATAPGAFLVQAYNSNRFFACCERMLFATPYDCGDVQLSTILPLSIKLAVQGQLVLAAHMEETAAGRMRKTIATGIDGWEGPVYLPKSRYRRGNRKRLFYARLRGETHTYAFLPEVDALTLKPSPRCPAIQLLVESHFAPRQWAVRQDAVHAKSKTYTLAKRSAGWQYATVEPGMVG